MRKEPSVRTMTQREASTASLPSREDLAQAKERAAVARNQAEFLRHRLKLERLGSRPRLAAAWVRAHPLFRFPVEEPSPRTSFFRPGLRTLIGRRPADSSKPASLVRRPWGPVTEEEIQRVLFHLESQASAAEEQHRHIVRAIQSAAGARKKEHAPEVFAAVQRAIDRNPDLTSRAFFDGIDEDGDAIYRTRDRRGREVLMQENGERTVGFATVRRYFAKARRRKCPR